GTAGNVDRRVGVDGVLRCGGCGFGFWLGVRELRGPLRLTVAAAAHRAAGAAGVLRLRVVLVGCGVVLGRAARRAVARRLVGVVGASRDRTAGGVHRRVRV